MPVSTAPAGLDLTWLPREAATLLPYTLCGCANTTQLCAKVDGLCAWVAVAHVSGLGRTESWLAGMVEAYIGLEALGLAVYVGARGISPGDENWAMRSELVEELARIRDRLVQTMALTTSGSLGTVLGRTWETLAEMYKDRGADTVAGLSAVNALQSPDTGALLDNLGRFGAKGLSRTYLRQTMHDRVVTELVGHAPSILRSAYDRRAGTPRIVVRAALPEWDLRYLGIRTHPMMHDATCRKAYAAVDPAWGHHVGWSYPLCVLHGVHGVCGVIYPAADCGLIFVDHGGWTHIGTNNWRVRCARGDRHVETRTLVEHLHGVDAAAAKLGGHVRTIDHEVEIVWEAKIAQLSDDFDAMAALIAAQSYRLIGQMVVVSWCHPELSPDRIVPGWAMMRFALGAAEALADWLVRRRKTALDAQAAQLLGAAGALKGLHTLAQGLRAHYYDRGTMWAGEMSLGEKSATFGDALVLLEEELARCVCSLLHLDVPAKGTLNRKEIIDAAMEHYALPPTGVDPQDGVYSDQSRDLRWLPVDRANLAVKIWAQTPSPRSIVAMSSGGSCVQFGMLSGLDEVVAILETVNQPYPDSEDDMPSVGSSWDDPDPDDDDADASGHNDDDNH